ncbi:hypothetical protein F4778DRAFT_727915 [Xylariomycetidae sp. FL2044]|nr:hypothetical protein F4778DRAFT_727915 [Xylariomycetidae sp. FL2044]
MRPHTSYLFGKLLLIASLTPTILAADCDTVTLDAKNAQTSCKSIAGDLVLADQADGEISLGDLEEIGGSLRSDGNSSITELSAPMLHTVKGNLTLQGLSSLRNISLPSLQDIGTGNDAESWTDGSLTLEDLTVLETVILSEVRRIGELHAINLPQWEDARSFGYASDEDTDRVTPKVTEIRDVAVSNLLYLYLYDGQEQNDNARSITISGVDNVDSINISRNYTGRISIAGNGTTTAAIGGTHAGQVEIAGVGALSLTGQTIDAITISDSSLVKLGVGEQLDIAKLVIQNNANFTGFERAPRSWYDDPRIANSWFDWVAPVAAGGGAYLSNVPIARGLELYDLPALYLYPNTTHLQDDSDVDGSGNSNWYNGYCVSAGYGGKSGRCMGNMTTVVLNGNITNDFFEDFIYAFWSNVSVRSFWSSDSDYRADIRLHGRVTERFELNSTVPDFDCGRLDALRDVGLFAGEYSCNGNTAPITRDAWAAAASGATGGKVFASGVAALLALGAHLVVSYG